MFVSNRIHIFAVLTAFSLVLQNSSHANTYYYSPSTNTSTNFPIQIDPLLYALPVAAPYGTNYSYDSELYLNGTNHSSSAQFGYSLGQISASVQVANPPYAGQELSVVGCPGCPGGGATYIFQVGYVSTTQLNSTVLALLKPPSTISTTYSSFGISVAINYYPPSSTFLAAVGTVSDFGFTGAGFSITIDKKCSFFVIFQAATLLALCTSSPATNLVAGHSKKLSKDLKLTSVLDIQ